MKACAILVLAPLLIGCTTAPPSLPQKMEIIGQNDFTIVFEFSGPERSLIIRHLVTDKPLGPSKDYTLRLYVGRDGDVGTLNIEGSDLGSWWMDMITVFVVGGVEQIHNPILRIDGEDTDIVKSWRRLARYDKRFVIEERPGKNPNTH